VASLIVVEFFGPVIDWDRRHLASGGVSARSAAPFIVPRDEPVTVHHLLRGRPAPQTARLAEAR